MNNQEQTQPENKAAKINKGFGINLIPTLTKEEEVVVQTKSQVNVGAAIALFILIFLTLIIVGFNIFAKSSLNKNKEKLFQLESDLELRQDLLLSNSELVRKINLYRTVNKTTYSSKDTVEYFQTISQPYATIDEYEITGGNNFTFQGKSADLKDISKLWYLLSNDKYIESINLKSVNKGPSESTFKFEGILKIEEFKKDIEENNGGTQTN